ncbi:MAG: glycosyltransferase family A protein [Syntrophomonadaceae bacterium]
MIKASLLITSYLSSHLLKWNLASLARQQIPFSFETIVLNDGLPDESEQFCRQYENQLNIRYVFTGQRNQPGRMVYRVPGFALNIGARLARGEIIIISCAEMFHLNQTIAHLVKPVQYDAKLLTTSIGMDDDGSFLAYLEKSGGYFDFNSYFSLYPRLNTRLPFLMAMNRQQFLNIGGYDEDMIGFAYDDEDLMDRLLFNGSNIYLTQALTIHLFHHRHDNDLGGRPETIYNANLYRSRKGKIQRNQNREWGRLDVPEGESLEERRRSVLALEYV